MTPVEAFTPNAKMHEHRQYVEFITVVPMQSGVKLWRYQGCEHHAAEFISASRDCGDRFEYVHRWVYEDMMGDIPAGLTLDHHHCVNRRCANPQHLEPVSRAVNNARGGHTSGTRKAAHA